MKNKIIFLKLFVGFTILGILIYKIGVKHVLEVMLKINIVYIPLVLATMLLVNFLGTWKLMLFFRPINIDMPFFRLYHLYFLSGCLSLFLPGRIGELFLVYFLKKEKISLGVGSALVIIDKTIGIIVTFILALAGFFIFFSVTQSIKIVALFLLGFVAFIYIIFSNWSRNIIKTFILKRWESKFAGFSKTLFLILKKKSIIFYNFILSLVKWIVNSITLYILFRAFEQPISFIMAVIAVSTLTVVSLIPISINGLGLKESAGVFLFTLVGIPTSVTTTVFLTSLIINYLVSLVYILLFFNKKNNKETLNLKNALEN